MYYMLFRVRKLDAIALLAHIDRGERDSIPHMEAIAVHSLEALTSGPMIQTNDQRICARRRGRR
jgi:hypothetical protein